MNQFELENFLNALLDVKSIQDYCPNGLQVEGSAEIKRLITGVTASQALIDEAISRNADAILVHHGFFWRGESAVLKGMKKRRLKSLLNHDINLYAYHLPLDCHPELGNNAMLAKLLSLEKIQTHRVDGIDHLLWEGELPLKKSAHAFGEQIKSVLQRPPLIIGDQDRALLRVAWCTGAAQSFFNEAIELNVDVFLSGEISEQTTHIARENDVIYMACGHHATERYGVKALGAFLGEQCDLNVEFIDIDNPV